MYDQEYIIIEEGGSSIIMYSWYDLVIDLVIDS